MNLIRDFLGIIDLENRIDDATQKLADIDTRLGHLAKRVDDNEALLKRIYDHLRAIWKI